MTLLVRRGCKPIKIIQVSGYLAGSRSIFRIGFQVCFYKYLFQVSAPNWGQIWLHSGSFSHRFSEPGFRMDVIDFGMDVGLIFDIS